MEISSVVGIVGAEIKKGVRSLNGGLPDDSPVKFLNAHMSNCQKKHILHNFAHMISACLLITMIFWFYKPSISGESAIFPHPQGSPAVGSDGHQESFHGSLRPGARHRPQAGPLRRAAEREGRLALRRGA